jgi:hypothetical protein
VGGAICGSSDSWDDVLADAAAGGAPNAAPWRACECGAKALPPLAPAPPAAAQPAAAHTFGAHFCRATRDLRAVHRSREARIRRMSR